jgi:hypothetical protein
MTAAARALICRAIESVGMVREREDYPLSDNALKELRRMLSEIDSGTVPERRSRGTFIGRLALDSWPNTELTSTDVMLAADAYLGLP